MSDFDKEAERERLREKYEREQADREATEKMSELLLQGATMTNAHCQDCGDPIFRYDGQEFCATCEKTVERSGDEETAAGDSDAEDGEREADSSDSIEVADPSEGTRVQFGGEAADSPADDGADEPTPDPEPAPDAGDAGGQSSPAPAADEPATRRHPPSQSSARRQAATAGGDENLHAARASLERTIATLTSQAEACDDPRDAEAYLAAAREAAETLSALRH
jgi:uncharacterized Zn finger protein (UPF0148 family)